MIFFLDDNFPKKAIQILEESGYKVLDIRGTNQEGLSDSKIFKLAKQNEAIFLATDKDFFHTIHLTEKPNPGIVVIALNQPNSVAILEQLNWLLNNIEAFSFKNECILLTDSKCSVFQ